MSNRYDQSRQRNYSELCNRSSSRSSMTGLHAGTRMSYAADTCEDYWEDSSVSIRSFHGCELPTTGLRFGACTLAGEGDESKVLTAPATHQIRPHRDSNEYTACSKRRRSFPPPLALCSTLSIKEGGRFVLKEMDADRPQGFFRVQRGNGRLRLQLVLTDENDDEEDDHEESCTAEVDTTESEVRCEETNTSNDRDCSASDNNGSRRSIAADDEVGLDGGGSDETGCFRRGGHDDCLEGLVYSDTSLTWQEVGMDARTQQVGGDRLVDGHHHFTDMHRDASTCGTEPGFLERDGFLTFHNVELSQFVAAESVNSGGIIDQEPLWNVDVSNQALASLSPWTAKQMCLHASPLVSIRPAIGLAMF